MTSTPTSRLRLQKQAYGDNPNAWGPVLNAGVFDLADEAWGVSAVPVNADVTLSAQNFVSDQARRCVLVLTGAGGFNVIVPTVDKLYVVHNKCTGAVLVKTSGGSGATVQPNTLVIAYCDGVNVATGGPSVQTAATTSFNPTGDLSSLNVQDALAELDAEKNVADGAAGTSRRMAWKTAGLFRWALFGDTSAEGGSNTGTDLLLARYDDTGAYVDAILSSQRSTGIISFLKRPIFNGATAWDSANSAIAAAGNGYVKLPNGLILQWGFVTNAASDFQVAFPVTFPTAFLNGQATAGAAPPGTQAYIVSVDTGVVNNMSIRARVATGGSVTTQGSLPIYWTAIGY